ncbi:hypothetical protein BG005_005640, partial [Podila minutissima]
DERNQAAVASSGMFKMLVSNLEMIQVKFHKYMVRFVGQSPSTGRALDIPQQRFLSYLAAEIFESARHHATYRFIVQDRVHGREMML